MPDFTWLSSESIIPNDNLNSIHEIFKGVQMIGKFVLPALIVWFLLVQTGCEKGRDSYLEESSASEEQDVMDHIKRETPENEVDGSGCVRATTQQLFQVNLGIEKKDEFIEKCIGETGSSCWCSHLVRPNLNSAATFRCTYGPSQNHQLIHPKESVWSNAIAAVKVIQDLSSKGIKVCEIYN